jgi:hypothetical protein
MTKYAIRRIEPLSAFKYGFSIGALIMLPTGLLVGLFARGIVGLVRAWMESWGTLEIEGPLGVTLDINLLNVVEFAEFLDIVRGLDDMGFFLVLAIIFMMVVFGGIFIGLQSTLAAWAYNLGAAGSGGGIIVHAEMLDGPAVGQPRGLPLQTTHHPIAPRPLPSPHRRPPLRGGGAYLVSSHDQRRYPIKAGKTLIGSAPNNDVVLQGLAPHHAEIRWQDQRYILYDRGGKQISVNERAIMGPNMLKDGFRVRLGRVDFVFKEEV